MEVRELALRSLQTTQRTRKENSAARGGAALTGACTIRLIHSQVGERDEAEEGVSVDDSDFVSAQVAGNTYHTPGMKTFGFQSVVLACVRAFECALVHVYDSDDSQKAERREALKSVHVYLMNQVVLKVSVEN